MVVTTEMLLVLEPVSLKYKKLMVMKIWTYFVAWTQQAVKLKFFGTRPNWAVCYIAYTKFHLPRPVLHSPGHIFTPIGEWASASFPACLMTLIWTFHCCAINLLRPRWNGQHFAHNIFKRIFSNENVWISITFSLKFVRKGPTNNTPALVQIMAWHRAGDKPLS